MKRIFVCEFITGGGMRHRKLPEGLLGDAENMFQALMADLRQIDNLDIVTCRDNRLSEVTETIVSIDQHDKPWAIWRQCLEISDIAWLIAPETDGILLRLNRLARICGCLTIACEDNAVKLTTSKKACSDFLREHKLPALETRFLHQPFLESQSGWVIKPDAGAGSEDCHVFNNTDEIMQWMEANEDKAVYIQQKYLAGVHASMSVLYGAQETRLLACNKQIVKLNQGKFIGEEIRLDELQAYRLEFERLAIDIGDKIDGLRGFVGIDLIIDRGTPVILEINPRLTNSFSGLSRVLRYNVAELVLNSFTEQAACLFPVDSAITTV